MLYEVITIGCGAHGKISLPAQGAICRTVKVKHPKGYLAPGRPALDQRWEVSPAERPFEYFMNRFRLFEPVPKAEFAARTALV